MSEEIDYILLMKYLREWMTMIIVFPRSSLSGGGRINVAQTDF